MLIKCQRKNSDAPSCPNCRTPIRTNPMPVIAFDNTISKMAENFLCEADREDREERIKESKSESHGASSAAVNTL